MLRKVQSFGEWTIYKCSDTKEYQVWHSSKEEDMTYYTDDLQDAKDTASYLVKGIFPEDNEFESEADRLHCEMELYV